MHKLIQSQSSNNDLDDSVNYIYAKHESELLSIASS